MSEDKLPNLAGGVNEKYRLTDDRLELADGREVFRIEALVDFSDVKVGDLGGYVETERDLDTSLDDRSWVYDNSIVAGNGQGDLFSVSGHSSVRDFSSVDRSRIYGESVVTESRIFESTIEASTIDRTKVSNESEVRHSPQVSNSTIEGSKMDQMGKVDYARVERSELSKSQLDNSIVEDSTLQSSNLNRESDAFHSTLTNVTANDRNTIVESTVNHVKMENGSEIYHSDDINESYLNSSSLNSMGSVQGGDFRNTHMQESVVNRATLAESNVQNSKLSQESRVNRSNIRSSDIIASTLSNVHLRQSTVYKETLSDVEERDYQAGIGLSDDDLQGLDGDNLQL